METHRGSRTCKKYQARLEQERKNKLQTTLHNYFRKAIPLNQPSINTPPPVLVKSEIAQSERIPHVTAENSTICHGTLGELHLAASGCQLPLADEKNSLGIFAVNPEDVGLSDA